MSKLQKGDQAPAFSGKNEKRETISLTDYAGKKLILFFYPKDNTPTCTVENCNLRDNYEMLRQQGFEILGVSPDSAKKHQNFIAKHNLPFSLLVDDNLETIKAYDVWGLKKTFGKEYEGLKRTTFVIDENGRIELVITKVKSKEHAAQIMDMVNN